MNPLIVFPLICVIFALGFIFGIKLIVLFDDYLNKKRGIKFDLNDLNLDPKHKESMIALLLFPLFYLIFVAAICFFLSKIL